MWAVTKNRMLLKVNEKTECIQILWWRKRAVNWPAVLNVKLPNKFYNNLAKRRKILLHRLVYSGNRQVKYSSIQHNEFLLKTESIADLLEFLCANSYPVEIIEHFTKKI